MNDESQKRIDDSFAKVAVSYESLCLAHKNLKKARRRAWIRRAIAPTIVLSAVFVYKAIKKP